MRAVAEQEEAVTGARTRLLWLLATSALAHALLLAWNIPTTPVPGARPAGTLTVTMRSAPLDTARKTPRHDALPVAAQPVATPAREPAGKPPLESGKTPASQSRRSIRLPNPDTLATAIPSADEPDSALARHAAFNAGFDRRRLEMVREMSRQRAMAREGIVAVRARCLIVPHVLVQRRTEYDSTITMPDGGCMREEKIALFTSANRQGLSGEDHGHVAKN